MLRIDPFCIRASKVAGIYSSEPACVSKSHFLPYVLSLSVPSRISLLLSRPAFAAFLPMHTHLPEEESSPPIAVNHPLTPKPSQRKSPRQPRLRTPLNPSPLSSAFSMHKHLLPPLPPLPQPLLLNPSSSTIHSFRQHSSHGLLSAHLPPSFKTSNHSP
jgi:hypothetical protein